MSRQKHLQISTEESVDNDQHETPLDTENQQVDEEENVECIHKRSKRQRKAKSFGWDFYVYLFDGTRDKISSSVPFLFNVEGDSLTYSDASHHKTMPFGNRQ